MSCSASLSFFCCDESAVDSISRSNKRYSVAIFMSQLSREHYVPLTIVPSAIAERNKQIKEVRIAFQGSLLVLRLLFVTDDRIHGRERPFMVERQWLSKYFADFAV